MRVWWYLWFCLAWGSQVQALGAPVVEVRGLFNGGAVLEINGVQRLLRQGQTSAEGVHLSSASTREAVLDIAGERHRVGLSKRIAARFVEPETRRAAIQRSANNQYLFNGAINGLSTQMLVDTGANSMAMSSDAARALGVNYADTGQKVMVRTASGTTAGFRASLDSVAVGDILLRQVPVLVIEGNHPHVVLLGMSFLRQVEMRDSAGVLYLEHSN